MNIAVVRAKTEDIPQLIEWRMEVLHEVFDIPAEEDLSKLREENLAYYRKALVDGSHIAVFVQIDGNTIGCGAACLHQEMPSPDNATGKCAYLMNIYARKEYRGSGVGTSIVTELLAAIKEKDISKVYLETSEMAKKLYRELGFEDMKDYMILK
nr:GNAT family N-acetyltransferase [uncultured Clostridium sp.]